MTQENSGSASKQPKRSARKPYEDRGKIVASLGYSYTDPAFDKWRESELVKPWWEIFVSKYLDTNLYKPGKKAPAFDDLYACIRDGDYGGRVKYHWQRRFTDYNNETHWHTWLLYRLVDDNSGHPDGCFYYSYQVNRKTVYRAAYHYILFAKWEHLKALASWYTATSPLTSSKATAAERPHACVK